MIRPDADPGRRARLRRVDEALSRPGRAGRGQALSLTSPPARSRARRAVRLRQDDHHADDQPADRAHRGASCSTARTSHASTRPAAPRHRLRDPAGRPVPAPDHREQHRDRAEAARLGQARGPRRGSTSCSSWSAWTRHLRRPLPAQLSGGQRQRVGVARALAADPPSCSWTSPSAPSTRSPATGCRTSSCASRSDSQDHRLRHPRHRRGDQARRPDRDPARGPASRSTTRPSDPRAPGGRLRRGLRRRRPRR